MIVNMVEAGGSDYDIKIKQATTERVSRTNVVWIKSIYAEITPPHPAVEKIPLGDFPQKTQDQLGKHIRGVNFLYAVSEFVFGGVFLHGIYNFIDGINRGNIVDVFGGVGEIAVSAGTAAYTAGVWKEERKKFGFVKEALAAKISAGLINNLDR